MATPEIATNVPQFMPLVQVAIGGVLTFLGGYLGAVLIDKHRHAREARNLALAFRGEITAIRSIVARRKYLEELSSAVEYMERTGQPMIVRVYVRREYFNVFNKNVDKIGTLTAPLPELIATFYTCATSVLEDFEALRNQELGTTTEEILQALKSLHTLGSDTVRQADELVQAIARAYP